MAEAVDERIAQMPEGLWTQPDIDLSSLGLTDGDEAVRRVRNPARLEYDYTPGLATTARSMSRPVECRP